MLPAVRLQRIQFQIDPDQEHYFTMNAYRFVRKSQLSPAAIVLSSLALALALLPVPPPRAISWLLSEWPSTIRSVEANSTYANLASGPLTLNLTTATINQITSNDDWSGVASVEGYCGDGLTSTFGVDPQTVVTTEFPNDALPSSSDTCVAANKAHPSAFNAGGLAEFDDGPYLAFGFQGNVQARAPYMVFYVNTTGRYSIRTTFEVTDIDDGSNNSVTQVAVQYRVGETGNFINLPAGYIADATDPNVAGRVSSRDVLLPSAADNQPKVQIRIITTDAAADDGGTTPDEWLGLNNLTITGAVPTAAGVTIRGRAVTARGRGIARASVEMWDDQGNIRRTSTNGFGYYSFPDVEVGRTYIFTIKSKSYSFVEPTQVVSINDSLNSLNFYAQR